MSDEPVIIPLSKGKLWGFALVSILFIILGFFFVLTPESLRSPLIHRIVFIRIIGFISLAIFGYFLGGYITKLRVKGPGLIVDQNGITDHSTEASIGFIKWEDVTEIRKKIVTSNKFMVVGVKNPDEYIAKAVGKSNKWWLKGNLDMCGSPIAIPSQPLKCKFKELENLLQTAYDRYKKVG